jgi:hypothetical protein
LEPADIVQALRLVRDDAAKAATAAIKARMEKQGVKLG